MPTVPVAKTIHSPAYRALLDQLKRLREKAGVSQAELAARLGRQQTWVSKVELGERRLDVDELRQVCEALGADLLRVMREWLRSFG